MPVPSGSAGVHPELRSAFNELLLMHMLAGMPEESLLRVLQTIPASLLKRALAGTRDVR